MSKNNISAVNSNQVIGEAIQKIALRGVFNPDTNSISDVNRVTGYVAKIHTEGDLIGTIDVQEYLTSAIQVQEGVKVGYHEGVYLSAIQDCSKGLVIVPKLHSEVTISTDSVTKRKYVSMFSHVDLIQLDSHEKITVGVTEREEYDEKDEDGPTVEELEPTGVFSKTTYTKDTVATEIQGSKDENHVLQTINSTSVHTSIGSKTSSLLDQKQIQLKHNNTKIQVTDGVVYVGGDENTDDAVLGKELAEILIEMLKYIGQIKTTTQLGPQPPLNIANFITLKSRIESFKAASSGFLTKKVQIQK